MNKELGKRGDSVYEGVKTIGKLSPQETIKRFRTRRLTNVKRRNDATTMDFKRLLAENVDAYRREQTKLKEKIDDNKLYTYVIFTLGVWRAFGTSMFAKECGLLTSWDQSAWKRILKIFKVYVEFGQVQRLVTMCYHPGPVIYAGLTASPPRWKFFKNTMREKISDLWRVVGGVAPSVARTKSWKACADVLCQARFYGRGQKGRRECGFHGKELVQDLIETRIFGGADFVVDIDTWSAIGPGAKRGLDLIFGRSSKNQTQASMLKDMKMLYFLFATKHYYKKGESEGLTLPHLELHDIQFGLCEFHKFCRAPNTNPYIRGDLTRRRTKFIEYSDEDANNSWINKPRNHHSAKDRQYYQEKSLARRQERFKKEEILCHILAAPYWTRRHEEETQQRRAEADAKTTKSIRKEECANPCLSLPKRGPGRPKRTCTMTGASESKRPYKKRRQE